MALVLNKREKLAVTTAASAIFLFVLFQFIVFPFFEMKQKREKQLKSKAAELQEIIQLKSRADSISRQHKMSESDLKNRRGFRLFSEIEKLAGKANIKDRLSYMRPSKSDIPNSRQKLSLVEMKIEKITLEELTSFLYMVETSRFEPYVKRLSITKTGNSEGFLNAILHIEAIEI